MCSSSRRSPTSAARRAEDQLGSADRPHPHQILASWSFSTPGAATSARPPSNTVEAFARFQADAVTVNPYMAAIRSIPTWPTRQGRHPACRTSNPGGSDPQFLSAVKTLRRVARLLAAGEWNSSSRSAWSSAPPSREIARVQEIVGDMPLLVPGIGAQGGDIEAVSSGRAARPMATGLMINSSRAILYAGKDENFCRVAARQGSPKPAPPSTSTAKETPCASDDQRESDSLEGPYRDGGGGGLVCGQPSVSAASCWRSSPAISPASIR